eukprot:4944721-Prymnesium_polylepis.1
MRLTVPDAQILTVVPFSLYGQQTSRRLPTSCVSKAGGVGGCRTSTLADMPAASRWARAASARSSKRSTLKSVLSSSRFASASSVPSCLILRVPSCGGAAAAGSCFFRRSAISCGRISSSRCAFHLAMVGSFSSPLKLRRTEN